MPDLMTPAQDAVFAALNVAPVTALAPVFQHVPDGTQPPMVIVGDIRAEPVGGKDGGLDRLTVEIETQVRKPARRELYALQAKVRDQLDGVALPEHPGAVLSSPVVESGDDELLEDGETYYGLQRFSLFSQPRSIWLAGLVTAGATGAGTLTIGIPLAGQVTAASTLTGALTIRAPLAGSIVCTSTLTGTLTNSTGEYVVDGFPFVEASWDNSEEGFAFVAGKAVAQGIGGAIFQTAGIVATAGTYRVVLVIDSITATPDFLEVTIFGNGTTTGATGSPFNTAGTHSEDLVVSTVGAQLIQLADQATDAVISKLSITKIA